MSRESIDSFCKTELGRFSEESLLRTLRWLDGPGGVSITVDGREYVNFSSNDYLGLARHPALIDSAKEAAEKYGTGSGASRLVCGSLPVHRELEGEIAAFKKTEAALTFSSGYSTALGTLQALVGPSDIIITDKLCHACLVDASRLSRATLRVFAHNDMNQLEDRLKWARSKHPNANVIVVTESVFSMDGDCAPLSQIVDLKNRYGAWLLVDEAHALGVIGKQGEGLIQSLDLTKQVDIQMGTLSKAIGAAGGYICGSRKLIDYLINSARSLIYSTAPSPPAAAAATAAFRLLETEQGHQRVRSLQNNIQLAKELTDEDLAEKYPSAIIPLILGNENRALRISKEIADHGFIIPAIRYPSVAKKSARLRLTLSSDHQKEQVRSLLQTIGKHTNRQNAAL